ITWSNKKWLFDGYQWQEKIIEEDIVQGNKFVYKLGKDYILYKANKEASFKLYKQDAKGQLTGDYVFDFNVTSWENIYNGYPNYIAYKPSDNRIFILPIKKKTMTLDGTYYLADGNLTPWSNSQLLIISQSISQEKDSQTFTFYSNPGHCEPYQDPVIVKSSLEIVNEKRHTGYFYHEKSATIMNDIIVYHKTDTIPGDEKFGHGWIEDNYESDNVQRRYFNAKQEEISAPLKDRNSKDNNSKSESLPDPKTTLFINKTNLEIAQFYNASVLDDEAAYLGFESYEIDNALAWNYERQNLIKNDWTLTGEYYLRLRNKNDSIHRTFSPKNQDCSYQAACWIRSTNTNSALSVDFKAIIKTNKQDIIGLLPAKLLISRGEWCYFEINIDLAQIKTNGTLTLIYSRKVNNKLCFFQEDTIKVENQQNPGFSALGVLKSTAIEQLLANVHNVELRSLVAPEIQIGFLQDVLPEIMKNKSSYKNIHEKYQRHQEKVNQCVYQINKDIGLKDNQQLDFKNLLEHIKQQPKYKVYYQQLNELKVVSDQIKVELENYSKSEDTFKDFIRHVIDTHDYLTYLMNTKEERTITTSTFDAIAILNNICFYVWKANSNNELVLFRTNEEKIIKPQQTINLLYTATSAQFQKLIDVTNKCLPKEKRESLKQGHEYLLIDLIIQPTNDYSLDIDHIRFSPRDQQFYARVYNPQTYQVTSLLDGNGSIKYVFYNQQYEPLAVTDWNKYLNELSIHGRHGTALSFGSMLAREQPRSQMKIKPIHGFYEEFSKTSFEERWLIDTIKNWKRTPGCLIHTGKSGDSLILQNEWLDEYSAGLHVQLYVQSDAKIEIKLHKHSIIVECLNTNKTNLIINNKNISSVPSYGEYLIISEGNRLWLWINGQLQLDQAFKVHVDNSNYLSLHLTGNVSLNQLVLFSKPAIDVVYKTILDEELQTIQLENSQTAIVSQTLYDDLGRQAIIIKPTQIIVDDDKPLLAFQNDFIQNGYIHQNNNVWQTGKLIGTGNKFNPKDEDTQPKSIGIYTETAKNIWTILSNEGYLYSANKLCSLFKKEFYQILKNYQIFIPEIIGVLQEHSSCQMGESSCDVEAYMIDENGNHRHYWTGYSRYELQYKKTNNQIEHIDYKSMVRDKPKTSFKMIHDALGNVTKAEHKGIMEIIYDPTTNRPKIIKLQDGRQVSYDYDVQGERVRKHVINRKGEKLMEVLYLRDGEGRSLVEKVIHFTDSQHSEQYTGYIYGPKEWDEETGLYNYHARLYDPDIGRFYQIDPQEQYASPYKYCGNSPISLIDPSGEIAFLPFLMIGLGVLGGYLGGSATNNSWLPWEWDLTKASTYLGIGGGALAGALAPIGITASTSALVAMGLTVAKATTITSLIGVAGMYLGMATGNHNWNMMQWQWSRPMTWSSGFQGFIFGASAIGGVGAWYQYYTSLGVVGKWALTISSGGLSISMGYLSCAAVNNSFSFKQWKLSLGTVFAGLGGAFGGFMVPLGFVYTGKFVSSFQTTNAQLLIGCGTIASGLGTAYLFGSAANNSFTNWNMSSPKTYESVMSGILFGISLPGLPKAFKEGMKNTSKAWKRIEFKNYFEKGKYGTDEQFAKEIAAAVDPLFDGNVQGLTKPSKAGAISITTTADGKKFFAYSGSEKNAVVYGVIDQKGNIHMHIEGIVPDLRDGKRFGFELIEKKLNITKQQVWDQSGMPNERGHTQPRAPETCGEPRAMQLTFEAGYLKDDILSFSTFKRSSSGAVPINACPNCQQYVPGKIYTESIFYNSFQNSFGHVIFTAQFSIPQLHQNSSI
ncbi:unnamed protein product, partial [Didymodactylos carnosus]